LAGLVAPARFVTIRALHFVTRCTDANNDM
jgi:hypothetical protein